jgi:hypothetical protein
LRNPAFKKDGVDYPVSADLTGQANHLGVTIEVDIVKKKQPENNGGYPALGFGRTDERLYEKLTTDHPIDLTRWQVANCCMGRVGLINSGGASAGKGDLAQVVQDRRDQQAGRRHRSHHRQEGLPASHRRRHRAAPRRTGRLSSTTPSPWPDQQTAPRRAQAHPRVGQGLGPHPLRPSARASDTFAYGRKAFGIAASWRSTRTSCEAPPTTRASGAVKGSTVTTT